MTMILASGNSGRRSSAAMQADWYVVDRAEEKLTQRISFPDARMGRMAS